MSAITIAWVRCGRGVGRRAAAEQRLGALAAARRGFAQGSGASSIEAYNVIQREADKTMVTGSFSGGFDVNGESVTSSLVLLPRLWACWRPTMLKEITAESLSLFTIVHPKPRVVILGCGESMQWLDPAVTKALSDDGIYIDVMDTMSAASTFNVMNAEDRDVACALLAMQGRESRH